MVDFKCRVTSLENIGGGVKMTLQEVHTVSSEEIERARQEAYAESPEKPIDEKTQLQKVQAIPSTVEAKIVRALKEEMPELFDIPTISMPSFHPPSGFLLKANSEFYMTIEQYEAMGSPPLLSVIMVSMNAENA